MNDQGNRSGRCSCGSVHFVTTARPMFRAYCHCTICQKFNDADYADVTVFYAKSVDSVDESKISFKVYQQPPLVQRGTCIQCDKPALEKIRLPLPLMPRLIVIPSSNFDDTERLPAPSMHIFYDKRVSDLEDGIKKYRGFVASQLGFGLGLMKGMISRS